MPVLIDEVVAEVNDSATEPADAEAVGSQLPLTEAEADVVRTLALLQQRQARLKID